MKEKKKEPDCFGRIEIVFPRGEDGLRHSPEHCMICPHKTECLRVALQSSGGVVVREEVVDRAYDAGKIGFFQRWSRKKALHRGKKRKE